LINTLEKYLSCLSDKKLADNTTELQKWITSGLSINQILPEAFSVVRETSKRTICIKHYDVQILGGMALHYGYLAELGTGEGKTLTAVLPTYLNALTGLGVHVVTVNDYLAKRDAEITGKIYHFLHLTTGHVPLMVGKSPRLNNSFESSSKIEQKKHAYYSDITFVTAQELAFDRLLMNTLNSNKEDVHTLKKTQNRTNDFFVTIDEADFIMIDHTLKPCVLSSGFKNVDFEDLEMSWKVAKRIISSQVTTNSMKNKKKSNLRKNSDLYYKIDQKTKTVTLTKFGARLAEKEMRKNIIKSHPSNHSKKIDIYRSTDFWDQKKPWLVYLEALLCGQEHYRRNKDYIVDNSIFDSKTIIIIEPSTGRLLPLNRKVFGFMFIHHKIFFVD
jgi:preprotein translocase subunit SecA